MKRSMSLSQSFRVALQGVWEATRRERNLRIHWFAGVLVVVLGACLGLSYLEWVAVLLAAGSVISLELINSAIEELVDHVEPAQHESARRVKDYAAGSVLVASITAAAIGALIFGTRLVNLWRG